MIYHDFGTFFMSIIIAAVHTVLSIIILLIGYVHILINITFSMLDQIRIWIELQLLYNLNRVSKNNLFKCQHGK